MFSMCPKFKEKTSKQKTNKVRETIYTTVLSTSFRKLFFALRFILNENVLF